ncbi:MAG: polysaccharide deacetylase family protein [Clostridiaceae bacterium]|nr:polysaccharide deacetylase family protein [Clostridiaceae bacterium]
MVKLLKKFLLIVVLTLVLIPVIGFRQILPPEPAAAASESTGTSSPPEEAIQPEEEEGGQLSSSEPMEETQLQPVSDAQKVKTAYLTFDDGPSPLITPKILEILQQNDIKATFFVIGEMAEQNPELIHRIQEEGHLICNHTYSHNYKLLYSSPDNFMADVTKWEEVLKSILGVDFKTNILRFPAGSFGKKRLPFRERAKEQGYMSIDWNALNGDAEALHIPADTLVDRIKETTENKDSAVVLMHDSNTKDTTAEALPEIIEYLKDQGYAFKTLESYEFESEVEQ